MGGRLAVKAAALATVMVLLFAVLTPVVLVASVTVGFMVASGLGR